MSKDLIANCVAPIGFADLIFLEGLPVGDPSTLGFRSVMSLALKIPEDAVRSAERFTQHKPQGCLQTKNKCLEQARNHRRPACRKPIFRPMADRHRGPSRRTDGPYMLQGRDAQGRVRMDRKERIYDHREVRPPGEDGNVLTDLPTAGRAKCL